MTNNPCLEKDKSNRKWSKCTDNFIEVLETCQVMYSIQIHFSSIMIKSDRE